jgi:dUTP pyrophosphatase
VNVKIKFLDHFDRSFDPPAYQSSGAAGVDLKACIIEGKCILNPGERKLIATGLSVEIPTGFEWQIRPRSGLSFKTNLLIPNSPGTIDSDYRGEVKVILGNFGNTPISISHGDRIAQAVLCRYERADFIEVSELDESERGQSGFGSTGKE